MAIIHYPTAIAVAIIHYPLSMYVPALTSSACGVQVGAQRNFDIWCKVALNIIAAMLRYVIMQQTGPDYVQACIAFKLHDKNHKLVSQFVIGH